MTEFRPGGFDMIPPVIKNLLIINVLVFFAQFTFQNNPSVPIEHLFALHDVHSVYFKPHQLITYIFMHGDFGHLFFNMFALWMFGAILENLWGAKRFLIFYIACGLGDLSTDEFFFTNFRLPHGEEWFYISGMGLAALLGQYFVTKAYANDKAGIVSAIGYSNIVFALVIGILLGDPFPGIRSLLGIMLVIGSGILISLSKK